MSSIHSRALERSYWRHAVFAASLFAVAGFFASGGVLWGTLAVELSIIAFGALPHIRRQEAHGLHRGFRRLVGFLGIVLVGLNITALVIGLPLLLVLGRTFEWGFVIDGIIGLGYLTFTVQLFKAPVDPLRDVRDLRAMSLPWEMNRALEDLEVALADAGFSKPEADRIFCSSEVEAVAAMSGAVAAMKKAPAGEWSVQAQRETIRGLASRLLPDAGAPGSIRKAVASGIGHYEGEAQSSATVPLLPWPVGRSQA